MINLNPSQFSSKEVSSESSGLHLNFISHFFAELLFMVHITDIYYWEICRVFFHGGGRIDLLVLFIYSCPCRRFTIGGEIFIKDTSVRNVTA